MSYSIDPATGLPMVNGLPLPLRPEDMGGYGQQPQLPPPPPGLDASALGQNPYGGISPDAVAGPGGGPQSLGGVDDSIRLAAGNGQGAQPTPDAFRAQLGVSAPPPQAHAAPPSQATQLLNLGGAPGTGSPAARPRPISVGGDSVGGPAPTGKDELGLTPEERSIYDSKLRQGGGTKPGLGVVSDTQKFTTPGAVPAEISQDIAKTQDEIDQDTSNLNEDAALHQGDALEEKRGVLEQQQRNLQVAEIERAKVNQRISQLQSASDAQQAKLAQSKPKELNEFWKEKGAAGTIAAAISVFLGGWGEVKTGRNAGVDMLNGSIDRWVNDQRQQYEAAKDKASAANNAYKEALAQYGTPEAAAANLQLQALTVRDAMVQNHAQEIGTQDALGKAKLLLQDSQLQRKRLAAQSIAAAGTVEHEEKLQNRPGGGSAADRQLAALRAAAEGHKLRRELGDTTNEDVKTDLEVKKAGGASGAQVNAANDAAEAIEALRQQTSSAGGRIGAGKGEAEALVNNAENKLAIHLTKQGVSGRAAIAQAKEVFKGAADSIRATGSADAQLKRAAAIVRGDAVKAAARKAGGLPEPTAGDEAEAGEPE